MTSHLLSVFLITFIHNIYGQSVNRISCGTNTFCYYVDLYPQSGVTTSQSINVYTVIESAVTTHQIFAKINGRACLNPTIDVVHEEIDFDWPTEYYNISDNNDNLIQQCQGTIQTGCGNWSTCIGDYGLNTPQIDVNDTYQITITGSAELNDLCFIRTGNDNALNVNVTINCLDGTRLPTSPPITQPPNTQRPTFTTTTTTTSFPNNTLPNRIPLGNNTWAYILYLYPQIGVTTTDSIQIFTELDATITYHDVYVINAGDYCYNPTINVTYERIDVDSSTEYFDVEDQFGGLIQRCAGGSELNSCGSFASCLSNYDLGISQIAPNAWYQIVTMETSNQFNDFCSLDGFDAAFNAILSVTCPGTTASPTTTTTTTTTTTSPSQNITNRYPFGNNSWLYLLPIYPQDGATTTDSIDIYTELDATVTYHDVYVINYGDDCYNPTIDIIYERIDVDSPIEYFDVNDPFDVLIERCAGGSESNSCGSFATCLNNYDLGISQISPGAWSYIVNIETSRYFNDFCDPGENAFNARLSVTCSGFPAPFETTFPLTTKQGSGEQCGPGEYCYYIDIYPSPNTAVSETITITSDGNGTTLHFINITSYGGICTNPTIDIIYEETNFDSPNEFIAIIERDNNGGRLLGQCGNASNCGNYATCFEDYPISSDTGDIIEIGIWQQNSVDPLCEPYSLNLDFTITCTPDSPQISTTSFEGTSDLYCDDVDCGWSFLCDEESRSCVRDCDTFDIDGYLKCSVKFESLKDNITAVSDDIDGVGPKIDGVDDTINELQAQLDDLNKKIDSLSFTYRLELNGGSVGYSANVNPMQPEIDSNGFENKYLILNTFAAKDVLAIGLLLSNMILVIYICLCNKDEREYKYDKTLQEEEVIEVEEISENEQLN